MAPNRPSPQDEPPEEVEASSEEEVDGEEEEESESEPESEAAPTPVAEKKPPPKNPYLATVPQSSSPGSEEEMEASSEEEVDGEEEEESGSESEESEPPKAALAEKKPPPKKPDSTMEEKRRSKASATATRAARAGSKRPWESDPKDSKRPKKKKIPDSDQEPDHAGDDSKKLPLIQRIWCDDDEITILEGMIDYYTKQGVHPNADMFAFHDFVKKSLKADVKKTQLQDKIRRLKKKYETNVAKGKKYNPVKPHELKVFDLSKKVWASGEGPIALSGLSEQYKCNEPCAGLGEVGLLEGSLEFIEEPKRTEWKEETKKLEVAQLELLVRKGELAKLILDALK